MINVFFNLTFANKEKVREKEKKHFNLTPEDSTSSESNNILFFRPFGVTSSTYACIIRVYCHTDKLIYN